MMKVGPVVWSSQVPVLLSTAPALALIAAKALPMLLPVQVVVPAKFTVRPEMIRFELPVVPLRVDPVNASGPLKVVLPVPLIVPLPQLLAPAIVTAPAPDSVPPVSERVVALNAPPALSVPPERTRPPIDDACVVPSDPPEIVRLPVPVSD